jgi:hypothetical protein
MTLSKQLEEAIATPVVEGRGWDGKLIGADWRLQWSDAAWSIEELPVKGGPRKVRHADLTNPRYPSLSGAREGDAFIPDNIMRDARVSKTDTYDQVKSKISSAMAAALEKAHENPKLSWVKLNPWYEGSRGAVMVTPEGADKIEAKGEDFILASEFDKFSVYSPNSDFQQSDPHYTQIHQKSAGAARKLYNILKKDPKALTSVTWKDLDDWLRKAGVAFDYAFSQWT